MAYSAVPFNPSSVSLQPIASLTPFLGGKQWIKARVADKSDIRTWNKPNSSGSLFSCTLMDDTASIRATFFNEAVTAWHNVLQAGQVYYIGGGSIKAANRKFSNVNNEYEISFDRTAEIHLARDAANNIPMQRYNFVPISALAQKEEGSPVDLLCVLTKVGNPTKLVSKEGKELTKRDTTVSDQTAAVDMTLWGDEAINFTGEPGHIYALRNVRVKHFGGGVSIGVGKESRMDVSPQISDRNVLEAWYKNTGGTNTKSLSGVRGGDGEASSSLGFRYFRHIESENLGRNPNDKADFITVAAVTTFVKTDQVFYDACPACNKKVVAIGNSNRCEKCNTNVAEPVARYMSSIQCSDGVTSKWITLFGEAAETYWGIPAADLKKEAMVNPTAINSRAQARLHKPAHFVIRVKEERNQTGMDGTAFDDRIRLTAIKVMDFIFPAENSNAISNECTRLIESIKAYHN